MPREQSIKRRAFDRSLAWHYNITETTFARARSAPRSPLTTPQRFRKYPPSPTPSCSARRPPSATQSTPPPQPRRRICSPRRPPSPLSPRESPHRCLRSSPRRRLHDCAGARHPLAIQDKRRQHHELTFVAMRSEVLGALKGAIDDCHDGEQNLLQDVIGRLQHVNVHRLLRCPKPFGGRIKEQAQCVPD